MTLLRKRPEANAGQVPASGVRSRRRRPSSSVGTRRLAPLHCLDGQQGRTWKASLAAAMTMRVHRPRGAAPPCHRADAVTTARSARRVWTPSSSMLARFCHAPLIDAASGSRHHEYACEYDSSPAAPQPLCSRLRGRATAARSPSRGPRPRLVRGPRDVAVVERGIGATLPQVKLQRVGVMTKNTRPVCTRCRDAGRFWCWRNRAARSTSPSAGANSMDRKDRVNDSSSELGLLIGLALTLRPRGVLREYAGSPCGP